MDPGGGFVRLAGLFFVERLGTHHRTEGGELLQRCLDAFGRQSRDGGETFRIRRPIEPGGDESLLRGQRQIAQVDGGVEGRLPVLVASRQFGTKQYSSPAPPVDSSAS